MWEDLIEGETRDGFGFILKNRVNDVGYQSITVPGSLKAYSEAHSRWGRLSWSDVLQPAIDEARRGVTIRPHVYNWWTQDDGSGRVLPAERLGFSKSGKRIYFHSNGRLKKVGETLMNPDLADTLERIAKVGADDFYNGEIAQKIAADMGSNGGLLTAQDLENYSIEEKTPLKTNYRGLDVFTNNPPGGGIMLVEMLNILENFNLQELEHNSLEYIRIVSETMKRATIDKDRFVGDPNFVEIPIAKLTSKK